MQLYNNSYIKRIWIARDIAYTWHSGDLEKAFVRLKVTCLYTGATVLFSPFADQSVSCD